MPALTREQLAARRAMRRRRERRRRTLLLSAAAVPIAAAVVLAVVVAASSGPSGALPLAGASARSTHSDPVPAPVLATERTPEDVTVARADGVDIKLPVPRSAVTAAAYHAVETPAVVPLEHRGGIRTRVAPRRGRPGSERAALDVGAAAGTTVYSPVDGVVVGVNPYRVFGKEAGYELLVAPGRVAGLLVRITHLESPGRVPRPKVGNAVRAGRTPVGRVADLSGIAEQELAQFTNDAGNHVHIEVVRASFDVAR
ncbi:MAG: hypothetical protein AB1416_11795 [Actinomycetota bacterium]